MPLETATYINQLVASNPDGAVDTKNTLDDHIRLTKGAVRNTLPNLGGIVTASHTELSHVTGVTSPIQAQLNTVVASDAAKMPLAGGTFSGPPIWSTAPSAAGHLTNKTYVDGAYSAASTAQSAANNRSSRLTSTAAISFRDRHTPLSVCPSAFPAPSTSTRHRTGPGAYSRPSNGAGE